MLDLRAYSTEVIAMENNKVVNLSPEEAQTYLHLGIIAANSGYRESIFKTRQQIAKGTRDTSNTLDLLGWFAQEGFDEEELEELFSFRNALLHSVVIVQSDGSVEIFDKQNGQQTYTAEGIKQYASRFYMLRLENRTTLTVSGKSICKCGAEFPQPEPEGNMASQEHLKVCPVWNRE